MSNWNKCYGCKKFLVECVPFHDIDTSDCESYIAKDNPSRR